MNRSNRKIERRLINEELTGEIINEKEKKKKRDEENQKQSWSDQWSCDPCLPTS